MLAHRAIHEVDELADNSIVANCVNCGGTMKIDHEHGILICDYCGSQQEIPWTIEQLNFEGETPSLCPVCHTPLSTARLEGCALLGCQRCFGMLIEMNRFAQLITAVRAREPRTRQIALPRRQTPADRVIDCPKCHQPMLSHIYGGPGNIVIDTCEHCLLNWLDSGELRRAAVAPER